MLYNAPLSQPLGALQRVLSCDLIICEGIPHTFKMTTVFLDGKILMCNLQ